MGRLALAWKILTSGPLAERVQQFLNEPESQRASVPLAPAMPAAPPKPLRSEAVTLLATLQREGRLIDFLKEPISDYSDAQVGAAVRDIHRDCGAVLERQFGIQPVLNQQEGSKVSLAAGTSVARIKRSGHNADQSRAGTLQHPGWMVTKCELPVWTGDAESAPIIAPAEVEMS